MHIFHDDVHIFFTICTHIVHVFHNDVHMLCTFFTMMYSYFLRFGDDIELMTGQRPNWYWMACWKYISPLAMSVILLASIGNMFSGTTYEAWQSDLVSLTLNLLNFLNELVRIIFS